MQATVNKFHINSIGDVKICKATKNRCQFGDLSLHFEEAADARKFVEDLYEQGVYKDSLLGKKSNKESLIAKSLGSNSEKDSIGSPVAKKKTVSPPKKKPVKPVSAKAQKSKKTKTPKKIIDPRYVPISRVPLQEYSPDDITMAKKGFFLRKTRPTSIKILGQNYPILTDERKSGLLCYSCKKQLTLENEVSLKKGEIARCRCGKITESAYDAPLGVFESSLWILESEKHPDKRLYHATKRVQWDRKIKESPTLRIHMGTARAASDRVEALKSKTGNEKWTVYSIKSKLSKNVKVIISDDLEEDWFKISDENKFVVYVNRWENPGSLSVMAYQSEFSIEKSMDYKSHSVK